jgi:hypothetical protein
MPERFLQLADLFHVVEPFQLNVAVPAFPDEGGTVLCGVAFLAGAAVPYLPWSHLILCFNAE